MAYPSCPSCSATLPDPARRFRPSCGGWLPETTGLDQPVAPVAGFRREIPARVTVAGLFVLLIIAAVLVQLYVLHPAPLPAAANASTLPVPFVIPEVPSTTEIVTTPGTSRSDLNNTRNGTGPEPPLNTTLITPAPSRTPAVAGPVITITGAPPYAYHAPAMGSSPGVPVINATSLEARVHELVNQIRQEKGLSVLGTDTTLASIARAHSADMAAHGYFGHVNLDGMDPTARGAAAGYTCHKDDDTYYTYGIAENLFATYRYDSVLFTGSSAIDYDWKTEEAIAEETIDAWMNSPDHRANLLATGVGREGIGVAIADNDMVFITEDFC